MQLQRLVPPVETVHPARAGTQRHIALPGVRAQLKSISAASRLMPWLLCSNGPELGAAAADSPLPWFAVIL